ncbi:MAG TPA: hypothetical protein VK854_03800 [Woeseiaceae bacterium]|nr:hypothetical protein [Woeseiaceae bacterium]
MASRPDAFRPVEAHGTLRLDTPGGASLALEAHGGQLRMDVAGWREARELMPKSVRHRGRSLRLVANLLATHGLTLSIESAGKTVVQLGHNVVPTLLGRLLGLAPAHVSLTAFGLLLRRSATRRAGQTND